MKTKKPIKTDEERQYDEAAELGLIDPITERRANLARRAKYALLKTLEHLEAVCDRNSIRVQVKVDGYDISNTGDWVNVCRGIARALFKEAKYWEFQTARLLTLEQSIRDRMQNIYTYYHQFAGEGIE